MHLLPELVDNITDHLFDDIPTLQSCSLVNHTWRYSSQYHLFHSIFIKEQNEESSRIPEFTHYLKSSLGFCTWAVRKVHLQGLTTPFVLMAYPKTHLHDTHILAVLRYLPSLQTLIIQCIRFSSTPKPHPDHGTLTGTNPSEVDILPSLQKLVIADVSMEKDHLFHILSFIKFVQEVHLLEVTVYSCRKLNFDAVGVLEDFGDSSDLNVSAIPFALPSLGIQCLTIEGIRSENCLTGPAFFKLLPSTKDSLISLDIDVKDIVGHYYVDISREAEALGFLLSQVGPQLHHLRVDLSSESNLYTNPDLDGNAIWEAINLSSCSSLRTLWISFDNRMYQISDNPLLLIASAIANSGSKQTLKQLTIAQSSAREPRILIPEFVDALAPFEEVLLSFPDLTCLRFRGEENRLGHQPIVETARHLYLEEWEFTSQGLPELYRRGILEASYYGYDPISNSSVLRGV